jgi:hypothetical protein
MRNRMIAGLVTMLMIGAALAPGVGFARGGGFAAGGFGGAHGFVGRGAFHAVRSGGFVNAGVAHASPVHVGPANASRFFSFHRVGIAPNRRFVRFFGHGLPVNGIGVWYGGFGDYGDCGYYGDCGNYDDVTGAVAPQPIYVPVEPDYPVPPPGVRTAGDRGSCRTQTQTVRSESGGERQVTIVRC